MPIINKQKPSLKVQGQLKEKIDWKPRGATHAEST
jgi:hypothetical protein